MLQQLRMLAKRLGSKPALVDNGDQLSYAELEQRCRRLSAWLRSARLPSGRICLDYTEQIPGYIGLLAGLAAGYEVSVARPDLRQGGKLPDWLGLPLSELAADPLGPDPVDFDVAPTRPADSGALISLTTGSTGSPKGARIGYTAVLRRNRVVERALGLSNDDVILAPLPLAAAYAQTVYLPSLLAGATIVLSSPDEEEILGLAGQHGATVLIATPTVWWTLVLDPRRARNSLCRLRLPAIGAEPIPCELAERVRQAAGVAPSLMYGATEVGLALLGRMVEQRPRLWPVEGVHCTTEVNSAGLRSLVVDGPLFDGYLTAAGGFQPRAPGPWRTGDIVDIGSDGSLSVVGRIDSMVKRGRRWISPHAIEADICSFPSVRQSCVSAVQTERLGDHLVALVSVTDDSVTAAQVMGFLRKRQPRGELPDTILIQDELPRLAGKIDRGAVHRIAAAALGRAGSTSEGG